MKKATESSEAAATADARLQRLLLGTNSRPLLPAGIKDEIRVIRVGKFIEAGEAAVVGFRTKYDFLCDISHPTYMHSNFHWLTYDLSWTNDLHVREVHRILDEVTHAAEMAVTGISAAIVEMYRTCMPDIDNYVASTKSSDVET